MLTLGRRPVSGTSRLTNAPRCGSRFDLLCILHNFHHTASNCHATAISLWARLHKPDGCLSIGRPPRLCLDRWDFLRRHGGWHTRYWRLDLVDRLLSAFLRGEGHGPSQSSVLEYLIASGHVFEVVNVSARDAIGRLAVQAGRSVAVHRVAVDQEAEEEEAASAVVGLAGKGDTG